MVTTDEDSTGSVGASSAPSRKHSVQPRSVSACAASATIARRQRHREHELAERQVPGLLEHLRLDLEPVAEQDHDQRDDRQVGHEARRRVELEHARRRRRRARTRRATNSAVSDRNERRTSPESSAPTISSTPNTARRRVEPAAAGRGDDASRRIESHGCASRCWGSRRRGRTREGRAAATSSRPTGLCLLLDCGCGVFGKLRSHREYWEVDAVVISHLHADHILDLVPVRVGAHLRAAPAAGAGRRAPGHRRARPARG